MSSKDTERRLRLMEKQVEAAVSLLQDTKIDLLSKNDSLKIEIETLKAFLQRSHPELENSYQAMRDEVLRNIDPEWEERPRPEGKK